MDTTAETRRLLRRRLAYLTGLIVMREELDSDITEAMGQISTAPNGHQMVTGGMPAIGPKRRGRPPKYLEAMPVMAPPPSGTTAVDINPKTGKPFRMTQAERAAVSRRMKNHWAKASGAVDDRPTRAGVATKSPRRVDMPTIGKGTNGAFIYGFLAGRGDQATIAEMKARATESQPNLTHGSRLSVAIAEMKRKGLLTHIGHNKSGTYRLTPLAHKVHQQESNQ